MPEAEIALPESDYNKLKSIIQKSLSRTIIKRCRILLMLDTAHGAQRTYEQIRKELSTSPSTIRAVKRRYINEGLDAIVIGRKSLKKPNRPHTYKKRINEDVARKVIDIVQSAPIPDDHNRWSLRILAKYLEQAMDLKISKESLRKILHQEGIDLKELCRNNTADSETTSLDSQYGSFVFGDNDDIGEFADLDDIKSAQEFLKESGFDNDDGFGEGKYFGEDDFFGLGELPEF